jgi:hypothetical protein
LEAGVPSPTEKEKVVDNSAIKPLVADSARQKNPLQVLAWIATNSMMANWPFLYFME